MDECHDHGDDTTRQWSIAEGTRSTVIIDCRIFSFGSLFKMSRNIHSHSARERHDDRRSLFQTKYSRNVTVKVRESRRSWIHPPSERITLPRTRARSQTKLPPFMSSPAESRKAYPQQEIRSFFRWFSVASPSQPSDLTLRMKSSLKFGKESFWFDAKKWAGDGRTAARTDWGWCRSFSRCTQAQITNKKPWNFRVHISLLWMELLLHTTGATAGGREALCMHVASTTHTTYSKQEHNSEKRQRINKHLKSVLRTEQRQFYHLKHYYYDYWLTLLLLLQGWRCNETIKIIIIIITIVIAQWFATSTTVSWQQPLRPPRRTSFLPVSFSVSSSRKSFTFPTNRRHLMMTLRSSCRKILWVANDDGNSNTTNYKNQVQNESNKSQPLQQVLQLYP